MNQFIVGIDSTDSPIGGCTTFTVLRIIRELSGIQLVYPPFLIRLNPNIPSKTRGNAAIKLIFLTSQSSDVVFEKIVRIVESEYLKYQIDDGKHPGVVLCTSQPNDELYKKSLQFMVSREEAILMVKPDKIWPDIGNGVIGALAAVSCKLDDFTYELISYRLPENYGNKRIIDTDQLIHLSSKFQDTFSCVDKNRELIAPSGPDPVFFGIRGDNIDQIRALSESLNLQENVFDSLLFITNQATDVNMALQSTYELYAVISTSVVVHSTPEILEGRVVTFKIRIKNQIYTVVVFEPTKNLAKLASSLIPGDRIYIHGACSKNIHGNFISLEFALILHLEPKYKINKILCECGSRMTSAGRLAGFKCVTCGTRSYVVRKTVIPRKLFVGQRLYAASSAQRHLTRPLSRIHKYREFDKCKSNIKHTLTPRI